MFQLLQSEAGFLTSLKIAIEVCPNVQLITRLVHESIMSL